MPSARSTAPFLLQNPPHPSFSTLQRKKPKSSLLQLQTEHPLLPKLQQHSEQPWLRMAQKLHFRHISESCCMGNKIRSCQISLSHQGKVETRSMAGHQEHGEQSSQPLGNPCPVPRSLLPAPGIVFTCCSPFARCVCMRVRDCLQRDSALSGL